MSGPEDTGHTTTDEALISWWFENYDEYKNHEYWIADVLRQAFAHFGVSVTSTASHDALVAALREIERIGTTPIMGDGCLYIGPGDGAPGTTWDIKNRVKISAEANIARAALAGAVGQGEVK